MDIKKQLGDLVDAMIAGRSADVDALAAQVVQNKAIEQVGDLVAKPPVTESVLAEGVVDDAAKRLGFDSAHLHKIIERMITTGEIPDSLIAGYQASEFVEDGEVEPSFGPNSGFIKWLDSIAPSFGQYVMKLMDQDAGYSV